MSRVPSSEAQGQVAHYRARDLLLAPSLLSLARLPLAACFVLAVRVPVAALLVLVLAGVTDVLDGWVARRYGLVTATGAALDGLTDKLFVLVVALTLIASGRLGLWSVLLLSTREIGEAPLVLWFLASPQARARRVAYPRANKAGKLATALQFMAVGWALFHEPGVAVLTILAAAAGAAAALSYYRRELTTASPGG